MSKEQQNELRTIYRTKGRSAAILHIWRYGKGMSLQAAVTAVDTLPKEIVR